MGKIAGWRVVVGGLLGGMLLFIVQGIVDGNVLKEFWQGMAASGLAVPEEQAKASGGVVLFCSLLTGVLATWLYAAVRPRLGAGLMTAVVVALTLWGVLFAMSNLPEAVFLPKLAPAAVVGALGNLIGLLLAVAMGGWFYREGAAAAEPKRGRR